MSDDERAGSHRRSVPGRLAGVLVVVAALLLAAAVVGAPAGRHTAAPLGLPWRVFVLGADALTGGGLAVAALLLVAIVWALATSQRRREFGVRPWWHSPVVLLVLALVTLVLLWQFDEGWLADRIGRLAGRDALGGSLGRLSRSALPDAPAVDEGLRLGAVLAGAVVALLGVGAWVWTWLRGDPPEEPDDGPDEIAARLAEAVDVALDDLEAEPDPRRAILRCYLSLDAALAVAGCPRRPSETAREHRDRAAVALGPAVRAAARLVDRFEHARYDTGPITEADRREAVAALRDVRAGLARPPADDLAGAGAGT